MATAVSYKSTAYHSKAAVPLDATARDLRDQCEQLRKELERKDQRNEKMIKEMQQIRSSYADLQREMRLTVSTIDKIKSEQKKSDDLATSLRNQNQLLQKKLQTAKDPSELFDQISKDRKDQVFLNENIVNLRGELSLRENKIQALQQELIIAHRALEAQSKYEHMMQPNMANNREIMRTLYFDMGKKQADLHSVTLALADVSQKLESTETLLAQTNQMKEMIFAENEKLKGNIEHLNHRSIEYVNEVDRLRGDVERGDRLCEHLQQRVEDTAAELADATARYTEDLGDKQLQIESLHSEVAILQQDKQELQKHLQEREAAARTNEEVSRVREAQLMDEIARLQARNAELTDKSQLCRTLQTTSDSLRAKLVEAEAQAEAQDRRASELLRQLSNKEHECTQSNTTVHSLEAHLASLHVELTRSRDECAQVTAERDEALEALKQTMRATRDLSQKLHQERERREGAERTNEQLLQAKANLSAATLDALYQERRKSAALEKSLALVPLVLKWRSACIPGGVPMADEGVAAYAQTFSSSSADAASSLHGDPPFASADPLAVQASKDVNFVAQNISDIAKHLDTSAGLHEGVNATFDWLLSAEQVPAPPAKPAANTGAVAMDATPSAAEEKNDAADADQVRTEHSTPAAKLAPVKAVSSAPLAGYSPQTGSPLPLTAPPQHSLDGVPTSRALPLSPTRSPGIAAAMAEAYKRLELPVGQRPRTPSPVADAPNSMMSELRRLRDELRKIEETAPANISTSTIVQEDVKQEDSAKPPASTGSSQGSVGGASLYSSTVTTLHRSTVPAEPSGLLSSVSVTTNINTK